jgi:hypothetical protein
VGLYGTIEYRLVSKEEAVYPIVWFAIMTALCVVYAERANKVLGPQERFVIDWPHAVSLAMMVVVIGFVVAEHDFNAASTGSESVISSVPAAPFVPASTFSSTTTAAKAKAEAAKKKEEEAKKKEQEEADRARERARLRAVVAFHAVGIAFAVIAAFVFWRQEFWYPYALATAAMLLAVAYYLFPASHALGNFVLVMVALGFSLLGRITTKRGFIVAYVILVVFDMYSIWGSDVMSRIVGNYPGVFPKFLDVGAFGWARGIGAGDVIFTAIACNHIHQHRGIQRAYFFAFLCTVGILIGLLEPSQTPPLLIFVSPIAILVLLFPKGIVRIE